MTIQNVSFMKSSDQDAVNGTRGRCSGTAGDATLLFDMILINGYNWQQITPGNLTRSGTTSTLTLSSHGFNPVQRLWITQGDTNDGIYGWSQYCTGITAAPEYPLDGNSLTFTVPNSGATTGAASGSTTLNGAIASTTVTSITVNSAASFPGSAGMIYAILIDTEWMLVTAGQGTVTWTVVRGFGNSTAATHSNGATVTQVILIGVAPMGGYNGWLIKFTGTNLRDYQYQGANQRYLDFDDTNAQFARVRGYGAMTSLGTGTDPFPTTTQFATAQSFCKSTSASTAARNWCAYGSNQFVVITCEAAGNGLNAPVRIGQLFIGELVGLTHSGDVWGQAIGATVASDTLGTAPVLYVHSSTVGTIWYAPRSYSQAGTAVALNRFGLDNRNILLQLPHYLDGGIYMCPAQIGEGATITRGFLPGIWHPLNTQSTINWLTYGEVFAGTGSFSGKLFTMIPSLTQTLFAEVSQTVTTT
jgi:hypothetical protein